MRSHYVMIMFLSNLAGMKTLCIKHTHNQLIHQVSTISKNRPHLKHAPHIYVNIIEHKAEFILAKHLEIHRQQTVIVNVHQCDYIVANNIRWHQE